MRTTASAGHLREGVHVGDGHEGAADALGAGAVVGARGGAHPGPDGARPMDLRGVCPARPAVLQPVRWVGGSQIQR